MHPIVKASNDQIYSKVQVSKENNFVNHLIPASKINYANLFNLNQSIGMRKDPEFRTSLKMG